MKHFLKVHTVFIYIIRFYLFLCFDSERKKRRTSGERNCLSELIFVCAFWASFFRFSRFDTWRARPQLNRGRWNWENKKKRFAKPKILVPKEKRENTRKIGKIIYQQNQKIACAQIWSVVVLRKDFSWREREQQSIGSLANTHVVYFVAVYLWP